MALSTIASIVTSRASRGSASPAFASIITVRELLFTGQIIAATNFQYFAIFTIIGAIYLALSYPGSLGVQYLERRMKIGYRPRRRVATVGGPTRGATQGAV